MNDSIFKPSYYDNSLENHVGVKRGARVFGMPVSKEVGSFLDEAYRDVHRQRLVDMYLAGEVGSPFYTNDIEDDEF